MAEIPPASSAELEEALSEEIKEYHFHIYFFQNKPESVKAAEELHKKIQALVAAGFFHPVPGPIHYTPWMPHLIGQFEVWCPKEHLARTYSWFLLNRGELSVLFHPLTRSEIKDHTTRAAWLGPSIPLDMSYLVETLPDIEVQFTELGMGYSAKEK